MPNPTLRVIFMMALRSGIFLLVAAATLPGQLMPGTTRNPDPSQGSVDGAGKFVPATVPAHTSKTSSPPEAWGDSASKLIEKTGEHTFRIGIVQCDRAAHTLAIPAEVNAREGIIEYALVTRQGKRHESLLSTAADPIHIQMAALLLGISQQPGNPQACEVMVEVEWATNGPMRKLALEELVTLAKGSPQDASATAMRRGSWKFTGSQIDANGFVAAREGSIIALIDDPAALIGNPRPGREDDSLHVPNASILPGVGIPVTVRIFPKSPDAQSGETPAKP